MVRSRDNWDLLYQYIHNWDVDTNFLCCQYSEGSWRK